MEALWRRGSQRLIVLATRPGVKGVLFVEQGNETECSKETFKNMLLDENTNTNEYEPEKAFFNKLMGEK